MALLTLTDLATIMGRASRPFTDDEEGQAQFIIDSVEAYIMSECEGLAFTPTDVVGEKMQADYYGIIEIKKFPISDITLVKDAASNEETWWTWDEFDTIHELDPFQTVLVSYSYGFDEAPADLVVVGKSLALRGMNNPLGIRQQTVGAISETYSAVGLTDMEEKILAKYRPNESSLRLGPQTGRWLRQLPTL